MLTAHVRHERRSFAFFGPWADQSINWVTSSTHKLLSDEPPGLAVHRNPQPPPPIGPRRNTGPPALPAGDSSEPKMCSGGVRGRQRLHKGGGCLSRPSLCLKAVAHAALEGLRRRHRLRRGFSPSPSFSPTSQYPANSQSHSHLPQACASQSVITATTWIMELTGIWHEGVERKHKMVSKVPDIAHSKHILQ